MHKHPDLHKPIEELPFSDVFKLSAKQMQLHTLADILEYDSASLLRKPGFNYHFLQEFIAYIEKNKMTDLLKD
ncbi:MAG: hypothetical protein JST81_14510 [Bacteroidetes bacterium]|nr:hypothetical protein [Bacteroidota bacterium]